MSKDNVAVIIPVYNEADVIRGVVESVIKTFPKVICVDDGSLDNSANEIKGTKAILIQHPINLGQGAALQTGIEYALSLPGVQYFVTFDADGQHSIDSVRSMLEVIKKNKVDIVVGSRFLGEAINITPTKKIILKLAVRFTNLFSGVNLTDTHNGLRVFNRKFAQHVNITMPGMAHASEIVDKMGRGGWEYIEVPVTIHYTEYSKAKGQSVLNSVNILMDILLNRVRR